MYLLLTAATAAEIQPAVDFLEKRDFTLQSLHAEILITGIGAVSTTYSLATSIHNRKPDVIIQAGIAGGFRQHTAVEVVTVEQDTFGDLGAWETDGFKNIFDLNLADDNQPPFTNRFLVNPYEKLLFLSGLEQVRAITVNEVSTDSARIEWYKQNLSPAVESMEGAALHYVGLRENIPFLQVRSVSNEIGERDKKNWKIPEAIIHLNEKLISLFNELSQYNETYFRI